MEPLRKASLIFDRAGDNWKLKEQVTGRTIRAFDTKQEATAGGVLGEALGAQGGSVRIHNQKGVIQEERTFPRSRDPRKSPG